MKALGLTPARVVALGAGLVAYVLLVTLDSPLTASATHGSRPAFAAAGALLMAIWWLTEAVPIYVTACLPVLLFPATGVFGGGLDDGLATTLLAYVDAYIFLFAGGMCIAAAMQQWNLHLRIALHVMRLVGTDPRRLLLGFLVATAFISMWISNTATAAMMLPIGLAVIRQFEARLGGRRLTHYGAAIMLAIAYAANVGGIGTKIGTAPNAQLSQFLTKIGVDITFFDFMAIGTPFVVLFTPVLWFALWRIARHEALGEAAGRETVDAELAKLGPTKPAERVVLAVFVATAALWVFGKPIAALLTDVLPGRRITSAHVEGSTAMFAALVLALWPVGGTRALALPSLRSQPWATLLLLGGSFAMADAIQKSGLSLMAGDALGGLSELPPLAQVLVATTVTVALSAVASNTATTTVMLGVLHGAVTPQLVSTVLFASTIAASCDFALPAGTPPNAIVFASGYLTIPRMAKTGVVLDLIAAIVAALWCLVVVRLVT
ncbi:DASS family sodium-coupled anion symporter [Myxococcota bacterium]|nr:DASS family sodium-coupled anion symporter [Myxococcota bacterium]